MSDAIKHECGLAFIRLRKPLSYYQQQYGTVLYGLNKLYLLMEKQHNRGQDGAGIATVKLNVEPGYPFLHRIRSTAPQSIADLFRQVSEEIADLEKYQPDIRKHPGLLKGHVRFLGELLLSRAFDLQADLLVMGCYGHARAYEWVLGGASRTVLKSMTLPVLMAH